MRAYFSKAITLMMAMAISFFTTTRTANASVTSYSKALDGVTFTVDKGVMKVKICKDDIIEVKYTSLAASSPKNSLVIKNEWKIAAAFTITEKSGEIILQHENC